MLAPVSALTGQLLNMSDSISELFPRSGDSLDLSELPERVAQVQSELQSLEEAVRQTKEQVRQVEMTKEAAFARQQVLQEQLEQDLEEVHVLQAQQEDLMALKAAQEQKSLSPDMHKLLQVCSQISEAPAAVVILHSIGPAGPAQGSPPATETCDQFFCTHLQQVSGPFPVRGTRQQISI